MFYLVKTPWWMKKIYHECTWDIPTKEKVIYLTFDDGPHPTATPFVLETLQRYNAKATFFCIGKNVEAQPDIYRNIIEQGHSIGNHTQNHLNGFKTKDEVYINNIKEAAQWIDSGLFRPPYGRITKFQLKLIGPEGLKLKPIMWTVLSGDFDPDISAETCLKHVLLNTEAGSIVVFHDSEKAFEKMRYALPKVLELFTEKGFRFEKIDAH
jgi:peptidoglycan-N-acetylglucosamine deacetylase